jgi:branched-chain amino acid transport system substrate-binding protein
MRWSNQAGPSRTATAYWRSGVVLLLALLMTACSPSLNVGIIAGLTGAHSELGVAGRNGALFRFEEENARRGMNRFVLTMEDDQNDPERVPVIIDRFHKAGIPVVIGPFTSTIALAVTKEDPELLFVSPTASAKRLAGLDDMLVRLMGSVEAAAMNLAREMKTRYSLSSVAVVWDINNRIYAEDYLEAFTSGWGADGNWMKDDPTTGSQGGPLSGRGFDAASSEGLISAASFLSESNADSVLIIASGSNTASIIRILRREQYRGLIMVAGWAITSDLSEWGTDTLEGVVFSQQYDPAFDGPRFVAFKKNFIERFGSEPSFGAIFGYEAADLVIRAMGQGSRQTPQELKKKILALDPFEALQGRLQLDSFGDPVRGVFLFQFRSGQPVRIE